MIAGVCLLRYNRIEGRTSANLDPNKQPDEEAVMSKKVLPSPEYLRQRLTYEPETGRLIWRHNEAMPNYWNARFANTVAGNVDSGHGYYTIGINGVKHRMHRVIWAMAHGYWPKRHIDHVDGNKLNNRIDNLRDVESQENHLNQSIPKNNKSGVIGVCWHKRRARWRAAITVNGRHKTIGYFSNLEEAAAARRAAEVTFGFHKNHGRAAIAAEHIS